MGGGLVEEEVQKVEITGPRIRQRLATVVTHHEMRDIPGRQMQDTTRNHLVKEAVDIHFPIIHPCNFLSTLPMWARTMEGSPQTFLCTPADPSLFKQGILPMDLVIHDTIMGNSHISLTDTDRHIADNPCLRDFNVTELYRPNQTIPPTNRY